MTSPGAGANKIFVAPGPEKYLKRLRLPSLGKYFSVEVSHFRCPMAMKQEFLAKALLSTTIFQTFSFTSVSFFLMRKKQFFEVYPFQVRNATRI